MSEKGCGLNGSTQHFVLDAQAGVYVEDSQEQSMFRGVDERRLPEARRIKAFS